MNKLLWITPDCFTDVDIPIIPKLLDFYNIHWIVVMGTTNRFKESDFQYLAENKNLKIDFLYMLKRRRDPRNIVDYLKIKKMIDKENPDVIYCNLTISLPWILPFVWSLPKSKTIQTAHQGVVHNGMDNKVLCKLLRSLSYPFFKYVNMFSKSQADLFRKYTSSKPKIFQFYLPLKDFGIPTIERPITNVVKFLSFGQINYAKNIDLLIRAACELYDEGVTNFIVSICGKSSEWNSKYESLITHPEIFENDIRLINNEEIPNLFNCHHYFVQPYRILSQSGPMKIAFRYNVPLITSDLPGFCDEMVEGKTGFIFETSNVDSLKIVMKKAIETYNSENYEKLRQEMQNICDLRYSWNSIIGQYLEMFNEVLNQNVN